MRQVIPKAFFNIMYGGATLYSEVIGGQGDCSGSATFGTNYGRHPVSLPGTFSHITFYSRDVGVKPDVTVTLQKNGVDTAMSVTLLAADTVATNLVDSVSVIAGDDIQYKFVGTQGGGFSGAMCLTFTSVSGSTFGVSESAQNQDRFGGSLGNGFWSGYTGVETDSNTYSICAAAGSLTRLDLLSFVAPGADVWVATIMKNGVLQNGTGGTVDTRCTFTGAGTTAHATFDLPIVPPDHLNTVIVRTVGTTGLNISASVAFEPTTAGEYMLCGGNNNALGGGVHLWNHSLQGATGTEALSPINTEGLQATGFYVERSLGMAVGDAVVHTVRLDEGATALTVTLSGDTPPLIGSILNTPVAFVSGSVMDIALTNVGSGGGGQMHWGLTVTSAAAEPTPTTQTIRRMRIFNLPFNEHKWIFLSRLEVLLEQGRGLTTGQGSDPQMMIAVSRDGGVTWGPERWVSAGRIGEYSHRSFLTRLGRYRRGAIKIVVTDPIPWNLVAAFGNLEEGLS